MSFQQKEAKIIKFAKHLRIDHKIKPVLTNGIARYNFSDKSAIEINLATLTTTLITKSGKCRIYPEQWS